MKKILILPILLLSLFLLTSCEGEEGQVITGGAFVGGTQGIVASFEPLSVIDDESGLYTIYDNEDFPLEVLLKNKGEETINEGDITLTLRGPYPGDFQNIPSWVLKNQETVEKISEFNPNGGEETVSFTPNNFAAYVGEVIGYNDLTWHLEYDYRYRTNLIINDVCFNGDISDDSVCNVKESKDFSISGAPITITSAAEDSGGKGVVLLKVDVSNVGDGKSTFIGENYDKRFDQLSFSVDEPEKWECKSGGRIGQARLVEGRAQIICTLNEPLLEDEVYTRSVRLTLDYNYKEEIQEKLRIRESTQ
jgi:hypothetical protein